MFRDAGEVAVVEVGVEALGDKIEKERSGRQKVVVAGQNYGKRKLKKAAVEEEKS